MRICDLNIFILQFIFSIFNQLKMPNIAEFSLLSDRVSLEANTRCMNGFRTKKVSFGSMRTRSHKSNPPTPTILWSSLLKPTRHTLCSFASRIHTPICGVINYLASNLLSTNSNTSWILFLFPKKKNSRAGQGNCERG